MQKRKGFTLVELVIVIAVIAILAGVLIGTFASVINKANESAKMQELKAAEHEQKANDLLKKIEDSNWYGWEDFETSIVDKLTKAYKENSSSSQGLTQAQVKEVVEAALADYAKNNAGKNTELTEEQVKAIIENALGTFKFNGVTEAQVKAIVSAAATGISSTQLTASQVKSIVNAANANNVTAAQVSALLATALKDVTTKDELDTALTTAVNNLTNTITTVAENINLAQVLEELVPITKVVTTPDQFIAAVASLHSGSTIVVGTPGLTLSVNIETDVKTLTIKGEDIAALTINAPKSTIYVINNVTTLDVVAVANSSLHLYGNVNELTVNKGRTVVEMGTVNTLNAAPVQDATVSVQIETAATITNLNTIYQIVGTGVNNYIDVTNNGTIGKTKLKTVEGWTDGSNTTNVRFVNSSAQTNINVVNEDNVEKINYIIVTNDGEVSQYTTTSTGVEVETAYSGWKELYATAFAGGTGSATDPYQISNAYELVRLSKLMMDDYLTYQGKCYILTADIDLSGKTWMPISAYSRDLSSGNVGKMFKGTFDGQGYTIKGLEDNNVVELYKQGITYINQSTPKDGKEFTFGLFGSVNGAIIRNINFENVKITSIVTEIDNDNVKYLADSVGTLVGFVTGNTTISGITVNGTIKGYDAVGGIVGRVRNSNEFNMINCSNSAPVYGIRVTSGLVGSFGGSATGIIKNCVNNGSVTSDYESDFDKTSHNWYYASGLVTNNSGTIEIVNSSNEGVVTSRYGEDHAFTITQTT